jgi:cytidyltransferase-like protein
MTKVMVFGTFDLVHPGHIHFFAQAKQHGDELVVVVARDSTAEFTKGRTPFFNEHERLLAVQALRMVDKAVLGNPGDVYKVVHDEKPDIICLGYDQSHFVDKLEPKLREFGLKTRIIRLEPFMPERYKSSRIREALAKALVR